VSSNPTLDFMVDWNRGFSQLRIFGFGGVVCVSLGVWGADGTNCAFRGVGVPGGTGENFTYGDGIRYNLIIRCDPVSYNLIRKVQHEEATV
jgi:hypothetical protein